MGTVSKTTAEWINSIFFLIWMHHFLYKQQILTVLSLLKQLSQTDATVQQLLSGSIQIRTKLSKGSHLTVLGKLQLHGTSHLMMDRKNEVNVKDSQHKNQLRD